MALTPVSVERFGGLNIGVTPAAAGSGRAVLARNVDLSQPGRVRPRDGYSPTAGLSASGYSALYPTTLNGGALVAVRFSSGGNVNVDYVDRSTLVVSNAGSFAAAASSVSLASTQIGTPASSTMYFTMATSPSTGVTLRKFTGAALGVGAGKPLFVATSPTSNRLVQGGYFAAADSPSGANGSRHTVFFSDAGAPDTYPANNFVTLRPGDGEVIAAIISWGGQLYVFKQTSLFIFYGEGVDGAGNPVFSYRSVSLPGTITDPLLGGSLSRNVRAVAGPDGVYFACGNGIWRTNGGAMDMVSRDIWPAFTIRGDVEPTIQVFPGEAASLTWADDRLFATYRPNGGVTAIQAVWTRSTNAWATWTLPAVGLVEIPFPAAGPGQMFFVAASASDNNIYQMASTYPNDNGTGIPWVYKSGKYSLAEPGLVASTHDTSLAGEGSVTLTMSSDTTADQTSTVSLGAISTEAEGWFLKDTEGRAFQHSLASVASPSGHETVTRVTHYVQGVKPAEMG